MKKNELEKTEGLVMVGEDDTVLVNNETAPVITMVTDDGQKYVTALNGARQVSYSSIDKSKMTFEEKAKYFNLINGEAKAIKDLVNTGINLKDIYMEVVTVVDLQTGEPKELPRIVLIDDKGEAYTCSSPTFLKKLAQLVAEVGQPSTWSTAIPIMFKNVRLIRVTML